jgi:predicted RNA-binding Zn ribbon-like protein
MRSVKCDIAAAVHYFIDKYDVTLYVVTKQPGAPMARRNPHPKYSRFRFDAGSLSLNFAATVRHRGSEPRDLLSTPDALERWFHLAGLAVPDVAPKDHDEAVHIREAIHDAVRSVILDSRPKKTDIALINRAAACPLAVPQLNAAADRIQWETRHPAEACLAIIARDAITLMGGAERGRLKMCSGGSCQMLFVDHSPANRRRWCAMSICGNREKIRLHRRRKKSPEMLGPQGPKK